MEERERVKKMEEEKKKKIITIDVEILFDK